MLQVSCVAVADCRVVLWGQTVFFSVAISLKKEVWLALRDYLTDTSSRTSIDISTTDTRHEVIINHVHTKWELTYKINLRQVTLRITDTTYCL